jgi:hypothetical protein
MLVIACGCSSAKYTTPIVQPDTLTAEEKNFQAVWDASSEVLIDYRFSIDRLDRRAGVISTDPQASKHFFELWRRDKTTRKGALENTVQPLYRVATVKIIKSGEGNYSPRVTIRVLRDDAMGNTNPSYGLPNLSEDRRAPSGLTGVEDAVVIGVGCSDDSGKVDGKSSPDDDLLARRLAEEIRQLARRKLGR